MNKRNFIAGTMLSGILAACPAMVRAAEQYAGAAGTAVEEFDIVVYGSTPAAISAAVQAKRMGKTCVVVSPETRIGGLTTGGLGQTDIGNKKAFGGIALEFYRAVADHYRDGANWKWQSRNDYLPDGQCAGTKGADSMWTFEPSAALKILEGWENRDGLRIVRGKRLDRSSVRCAPASGARSAAREARAERRITSFFTEDGTEYRGKMFVDATYEGDLMAAAGVAYTFGREANAQYGETLNGAQVAHAVWHQFPKGVDPYVVPGDPTSGLLPNVEPGPIEKDGTGDRRVQAYCFRMCLTDVPENRIPFAKPDGYDERAYELLFRMFAAKPAKALAGDLTWKLPWINSKMPNRKTDTNNRDAFSTDFIGRNWNWPEASYAEREAILAAHLKYQRGLMWTLANHPRVPEVVRREVSKWGTCKDEFADGLGDGWQRQLYVREARRMVGDYVVSEADCTGRRIAPRPVAMAAYTMDSHNVRRYVGKDGFVHNEGDVEVDYEGGPFGIDYGAIVPKADECGNLFVPVCLSASHIAFGSIRMEPVFFALGQAAATAAALAIDAHCAVQDLAYGPLADRLRADGQVFVLDEPPTEVVVAAANSCAFERKAADFVCTGRNDERVMNAAIARLAAGGTLRLADGDYFIDAFEQEDHSAVCMGYNNGFTRVVTVKGTTEGKAYGCYRGAALHVTRRALASLPKGTVGRVFYGEGRIPRGPDATFVYTHVNNANFTNIRILFYDASRPVIGIDGRHFGSMELDFVGIYTERYFRERYEHLPVTTPAVGTIGVYSLHGSNDESARNRYNEVNVGGLYKGFVFDEVDHLVLTGCMAARCVYGYWFEKGGPKTLTMINCCDEGNAHLPHFGGKGHLTAIDFNVERFNAAYIPRDPTGNTEPAATEAVPGGWRGFISYTLQGTAFGLGKGNWDPARFWKDGHGGNIRTVDLNAD